jgi:hypothetical protein
MSAPPSRHQLFPATTIEVTSDGRFTASVSATRFKEPAQQSQPDLWRHTHPPVALQDTPLFYQHLISTPPSAQECENIAAELRDKTLVACSDGACDTSKDMSSYATVLASGLLQQQIATAAGPVDGHPALVTSY